MDPLHRITKMVTELSDLNTLKWIGVALVIHVVVIGGFSAGYIRESLLGAPKAPEPAATADSKGGTTQPAAAGGGTGKAAGGGAAGLPKSPETDDARLMRERKDAPVIKKVTELPQPKEIPTMPTGGLPLDIEDANKAGKPKG